MRRTLIFLLCLALVLGSASQVFAGGGYWAYRVRLGTDARIMYEDGSLERTPAKSDLKTTDESHVFYTFEGHKVYLYDASIYDLGSLEGASSNRSVSYALKDNQVATAWALNPTHSETIDSYGDSIISMNAFYREPQVDTIRLNATGKNHLENQNAEEAITLHVLPCPALDSVSLGGEQRSARLQYLTVTLAQNPSYTIKTHSIEIPGAILGDEQLVHMEDDEYLKITIPFVTYNDRTQNYTYKISAVDGLGRSMASAGTFTVLADEAPSGSIEMENRFFREADGYAHISAGAILNSSDDRVCYSWQVKNSSGQVIASSAASADSASPIFDIAVPGKYQMVLTISDVWDNGFTSDAYHKSSTITKTFVVDNTAPRIGLAEEEIEPVTLGLVLLNYAGDKAALAEQLRDNNIIADIGAAQTPAKDSKESFSLVSSQASLEQVGLGKIDEMEGYAAGTFPVFDIDGNVNYYIKTIAGKPNLFNVVDKDGTVVASQLNLKTGPSNLNYTVASRQAFGFELEGGNLVIVYLAREKTKTVDSCPVQIFTVSLNSNNTDEVGFYTSSTAFTKAYKFGNDFVLTRNTALVSHYEFTPSYAKVRSEIESQIYSDENDFNITYDLSYQGFDVNELISVLAGGSGGGSGAGSGTGSSSDGNFTFTYYDLEGDPMGQAWYEYNGKTVRVDSLSISVKPVKGKNELKFWAVDNCGNPSYNKKSNVITVYLNGDEPDIPDTPPAVSKYLLHRVY